MRWYNPSLRGFEWRSAPEGDEVAQAILNESSRSRPYFEAYWSWRNLGATAMASLILAGGAAKEADGTKQGKEVGSSFAGCSVRLPLEGCRGGLVLRAACLRE
jgi:hypothetical protein